MTFSLHSFIQPSSQLQFHPPTRCVQHAPLLHVVLVSVLEFDAHLPVPSTSFIESHLNHPSYLNQSHATLLPLSSILILTTALIDTSSFFKI